jgi:hypothetical protein
MKQEGHACPFVSIFFPVVSAGQSELLWNVVLMIPT